ncbi:MAG: hypothetical protein Q9223_000295 [Gallowayella weberi]
MSTESVQKDASSIIPPTDPPARSTYKSYRKKYLKMRHGFKEKMRESNALFEDEQQAVRIANRLQERNDQLLELLHTCNRSLRVPPPLRYTLSPTPSASAVPSLEPDEPQPPVSHPSPHSALAARDEAYQEFARGEMSPARFREISSQLTPYLANPTRLSSILGRVSHTTLESIPPEALPANILQPDTLAYLTSSHEDSYLNHLDSALGSSDPEAALAALDREHPLSIKDTQRDLLVRNPSSAHNWLRKHRPTLFANTTNAEKPAAVAEPAQEQLKPKPSPKPNTSHPGGRVSGRGGQSKRDRESAMSLRAEPEMLDDEGNLIGGGLDGPGGGAIGGTGRGGKRKRGEDDAYRPKGGSSRPVKKRMRTGTGTGKGAKAGAGAGGGGGGGAMEED